MVPIRAAGLILNERSEEQVVLLREEAGRRQLSFETGTCEGLALEALLSGRPRPGPTPHELLLGALSAVDALLTRVELRAEGARLSARVFIQSPGKERRELEARPSDALALALLAGAPLLASEELLRDE